MRRVTRARATLLVLALGLVVLAAGCMRRGGEEEERPGEVRLLSEVASVGVSLEGEAAPSRWHLRRRGPSYRWQNGERQTLARATLRRAENRVVVRDARGVWAGATHKEDGRIHFIDAEGGRAVSLWLDEGSGQVVLRAGAREVGRIVVVERAAAPPALRDSVSQRVTALRSDGRAVEVFEALQDPPLGQVSTRLSLGPLGVMLLEVDALPVAARLALALHVELLESPLRQVKTSADVL